MGLWQGFLKMRLILKMELENFIILLRPLGFSLSPKEFWRSLANKDGAKSAKYSINLSLLIFWEDLLL